MKLEWILYVSMDSQKCHLLLWVHKVLPANSTCQTNSDDSFHNENQDATAPCSRTTRVAKKKSVTTLRSPYIVQHFDFMARVGSRSSLRTHSNLIHRCSACCLRGTHADKHNCLYYPSTVHLAGNPYKPTSPNFTLPDLQHEPHGSKYPKVCPTYIRWAPNWHCLHTWSL